MSCRQSAVLGYHVAVLRGHWTRIDVALSLGVAAVGACVGDDPPSATPSATDAGGAGEAGSGDAGDAGTARDASGDGAKSCAYATEVLADNPARYYRLAADGTDARGGKADRAR